MENDTLREIIDVEKEIQQSVDLEKLAMSKWLESKKSELEEGLARGEEEIQESFRRLREAAIENAQKRASNIFTEAEQQAARLIQLRNDVLTSYVMNHLHEILPE
jgi:vacuolar-type H+-ATPase subunit H